MKQKIPVPNRSIHQLIKEEGLIEALTRLHCNEKLSFIDDSSVINTGAEIGYYCLVKNCQIGKNVKIYHQCNLYGCKIGDGTQIASQVEIQRNVKVGENCKIGAGSFIPEGSIIGDGVFLGPKTVLCNDKFPKAINNEGELKKKADWKLEPVIIEDGASLGANVTILPGIKIGKNSLIGASSLVTDHIPENETWFGQPARPQIKDEEWKDIDGYDGLYKISNYGRIVSFINSIDGEIMSGSKTTKGYHSVSLKDIHIKNQYQNKKVSRLVASAFISNLENKPCVNHKNGNKWDDRVSNLEWVTHSENTLHAYKTGLIKVKKGKDHHNYGRSGKLNGMSKAIIQIDPETDEVVNEYDSILIAAKTLNINDSSIGRALKLGGENKCAGFKWKYKDELPIQK